MGEIDDDGPDWPDWQYRLFGFLAAPAHGWLWLVAKSMGAQFRLGSPPPPSPPDEDDEDDEDEGWSERKYRLFEFLAAPAHCWLWLVSAFMGTTFRCGRGSDPDKWA